MAKRSQSTEPPAEVHAPEMRRSKARKRAKRMERELIELRATEAKRRKQLGEVLARALKVRTRLAALQSAGSDAAADGPMGYCLREKRRVRIVGPKPVTLSNGRLAIAGTCSICGDRLMVLSARVVTPD